MGPGEYLPDITAGVTDPAQLPSPRVRRGSRNYRRRRCPQCGQSSYRDAVRERGLHDLGDPRTGRPVELRVTYSLHRCEACQLYFSANMSDLAPRHAQYTQRVVSTAVRLVCEDGLPYRVASWQLWRDHRVFVPFATIQNWVEAAGEKRQRPLGDRAPACGTGGLLGVCGRRRVV